jgi:hypothetical protein
MTMSDFLFGKPLLTSEERAEHIGVAAGIPIFGVNPLMDYILTLEQVDPEREIAAVLPELVVRHWWENLLHNQRVQLLKLMLLLKGKQRIVVVNIPWYL